MPSLNQMSNGLGYELPGPHLSPLPKGSMLGNRAIPNLQLSRTSRLP